jgi:MYXO-CTERM domain-containing protein
MPRKFLCSLTSPVVPLLVLFVATAAPARLYAEAAAPPPACSTPPDPACDGSQAGAACTSDAGAGLCVATRCSQDGGVFVDELVCGPFPAEAGAADASPDTGTPGPASDASADGAANDAGSGGGSSSSGCSASTTGTSAGFLGPMLGLLVAVAAFARRRRR